MTANTIRCPKVRAFMMTAGPTAGWPGHSECVAASTRSRLQQVVHTGPESVTRIVWGHLARALRREVAAVDLTASAHGATA